MEAATETTTEAPTEAPTEVPTEAATEAPTETQPSEEATEPEVTEAPTEAEMESAETEPEATGVSTEGETEPTEAEETVSVDADTYYSASGTCGDNLTWILDDTGTLTISGTGAMYDYNWSNPWYDWRTSIQSVVIENGVTSIGGYAFYSCSSLTSVAIPNSVTSIGDGAFRYCTSVSTITIPSGVTSIGNSAFDNCTSLFSVTIPNSVISIGDFTFSCCSSLASIVIPNSVVSIGSDALSRLDIYYDGTKADRISKITIDASSNCGMWHYNDGVVEAFGTYGSNLTWTLANGTLTINGTGIANFDGNPWGGWRGNVHTVFIESGAVSLGYGAFYDFYSLTLITIPDTVTFIEDYAFYNCTSLTDVYYCGTKSGREGITIGDNNDYLTNATWHYGTHVMTKVEAVTATCTESGNNAYYYCTDCGGYFKDEAGTIETTVEAETIAVTGHNYVDGKCTMCGAAEPNAQTTVSTIAITRLFNPATGEHLLASSDVEINLLTGAGWSIDGIMCYMPTSGTPIYRLYNPYSGEHLYTMVQAEISNLTGLGWTADGVIAYSATSGGTPIYRLYNSSAAEISSHLLSTSQEEMNNLVASGWTIEGIALYAA